jgi:hypothetical protein
MVGSCSTAIGWLVGWLVGCPLDGLEHPVFSWLGQGDGDTLTAGPADPADAVHIGVGGTGDVVVDHVGELLDIQAAGGDVGDHQKVDAPAAQPAHDAVALGLVHATVQRFGAVAAPVQGLGELLNLVPGAAKDQRSRGRLHIQHPPQRRRLVGPRDHIGALAHQ